GRVAGLTEMQARMAELEDALPGTMFSSLRDQLRRIDGIEQDILVQRTFPIAALRWLPRSGDHDVRRTDADDARH
ncbi:MAG: transposase, partial [Paraburkholderia sp.]|nr:transposase [Paraburkholderia sp.]